MILLVNTMSRTTEMLGTVISRHRTVEAAEKADRKLQASIRRNNGQSSYLPTIMVRELDGRLPNRLYRLPESAWKQVSSLDY